MADSRFIAFIAPTAFSDSAEPPSEFVLIRFGSTEYTKGRDDGYFMFDDKDADRVIADFARRKKDLVIDYDHSTVNGGEAPAAGWIKGLRKTADGLVATVDWTERASGMLGSREYRYHSPVIFFDNKTGRPASIHSVALTNHPAFHGYEPLVADDNEPQKETHMNETLKKIAEALGVAIPFADGAPDEQALAAQVLARLAEIKAEKAEADAFLESRNAKTFNDVTGQIAGMVPASEKAELADRLAAIEAEKAVAKAFDDGKLVEAQRQWALSYAKENPAAFADFIKTAPQAVPAPAATVPAGKPPKSDDANKVAFSDSDMGILARLGVTPEETKNKEN